MSKCETLLKIAILRESNRFNELLRSSRVNLSSLLVAMVVELREQHVNLSDSEIANTVHMLYSIDSNLLSGAFRDGRLSDVLISVSHLYRLFEVRCPKDALHDSSAATPVSKACYMLWDMAGGLCDHLYTVAEEDKQKVVQLLSAMSETDNWACTESIIHACGHLQFPGCKVIVQQIALRYGEWHPLGAYASEAFRGELI